MERHDRTAPPALPQPVEEIRADFPLLAREINGKPLVYLDNAATSQKPASVIEAIDSYYRHSNANIHRAVYDLGEESTALYEGAQAEGRRLHRRRSSRRRSSPAT